MQELQQTFLQSVMELSQKLQIADAESKKQESELKELKEKNDIVIKKV